MGGYGSKMLQAGPIKPSSVTENPPHRTNKRRQRRDREKARLRMLVAASKGGHWEQAMLLRDAFQNFDVTYVTTDRMILVDGLVTNGQVIPDCNRHRPLLIFWCALKSMLIVLRNRPQYILSTGALPGLFCIVAGRLVGAKTIWVDSIANAERLSMCGRVARRLASLCLTQWEHLARPNGPTYSGSIL